MCRNQRGPGEVGQTRPVNSGPGKRKDKAAPRECKSTLATDEASGIGRSGHLVCTIRAIIGPVQRPSEIRYKLAANTPPGNTLRCVLARRAREGRYKRSASSCRLRAARSPPKSARSSGTRGTQLRQRERLRPPHGRAHAQLTPRSSQYVFFTCVPARSTARR